MEERKWLSTGKIVIGVIVLFFILLLSIPFILPYEYTTLVKVDTQQYNEIVDTYLHPQFEFVSFRDSPFGSDIKILRIRFHRSIGNGFTYAGELVDNWLGGMGVISYPELVK